MWNITEVMLDGTNPFVKPEFDEKALAANFEEVNIDGESTQQEAPKMNTQFIDLLFNISDNYIDDTEVTKEQ